MADRRVRKLAANQAAATPIECFGYNTLIVQVHGLSGGDSIAVQGTVDSVNYVTMSAVDLNAMTNLTSITADGLYSYSGTEFVQYVKTGTASTPTVSFLLKE